MKTLFKWLAVSLMVIACGSVLAQTAAGQDDTEERQFETLTVGELSFTNVWVHRQTNFNILIRHSRGIHTIKLTDLPSDQLAALQSQIGDLADVTPPPSGVNAEGLLAKLQAMLGGVSQQTLIIAGAIILLLLLLTVMRSRQKETPMPPRN